MTKMQVKDIPDELVYQCILACKAEKEHAMRTAILDYDELSDSEKIRASGYLIQLKLSGMKNIPKPDFSYPYECVDIPVKLFMRKMGKMVDQDKLDYGVSLRTAWINHD